MKTSDMRDFSEAVIGMLSVLSHGKTVPDAVALRVWFRTLEPYSLPHVLAGMDAHMRAPTTGRTLPIPSDIVAQITGAAQQDGRPDGDEAWAICAPAADEHNTVVWSNEMAEAWGACLPLVTLGDMVAARKAFLAAYSRLVGAARAQGKGLVWVATLGLARAAQADAIRLAAQQGRIAGGQAADVLELVALPAPDVSLLRLGYDGKSSDAKTRALAALRSLRSRMVMAHDDSGCIDDSDRRATDAIKRAVAADVAAYGVSA